MRNSHYHHDVSTTKTVQSQQDKLYFHTLHATRTRIIAAAAIISEPTTMTLS